MTPEETTAFEPGDDRLDAARRAFLEAQARLDSARATLLRLARAAGHGPEHA